MFASGSNNSNEYWSIYNVVAFWWCLWFIVFWLCFFCFFFLRFFVVFILFCFYGIECCLLFWRVQLDVSHVRRGALYTQQLAVILSVKVSIAASCWSRQTCRIDVILRLFLECCFQIWLILWLFSFGLTYTIYDDIYRCVSPL